MIASGQSEGTYCKAPFKKDLMIRRLSPSEVGICLYTVQWALTFPHLHRHPVYRCITSFQMLYFLCTYSVCD